VQICTRAQDNMEGVKRIYSSSGVLLWVVLTGYGKTKEEAAEAAWELQQDCPDWLSFDSSMVCHESDQYRVEIRMSEHNIGAPSLFT